MTLTITLDTDNAAFEPRISYEVARILRQLANRVMDDGIYLDGRDTFPPILDINGNTVGTVEITA